MEKTLNFTLEERHEALPRAYEHIFVKIAEYREIMDKIDKPETKAYYQQQILDGLAAMSFIRVLMLQDYPD
jgi:hypothetical protein